MYEVCRGSVMRCRAGRSLRPISEQQCAVDPSLKLGQIVNYPGWVPRRMEMKIAVNFRRPAPEKPNFGLDEQVRGGGDPKNVVAFRGERCGIRSVSNGPEYFPVGVFGEFQEFVGCEPADQGAVHRCDVLEEPVLHKK